MTVVSTHVILMVTVIIKILSSAFSNTIILPEIVIQQTTTYMHATLTQDTNTSSSVVRHVICRETSSTHVVMVTTPAAVRWRKAEQSDAVFLS
jgi:hypothetical protein